MHDTGRTKARQRQEVTRGEVTKQGTMSRNPVQLGPRGSKLSQRMYISISVERVGHILVVAVTCVWFGLNVTTDKRLDLEGLPLPCTIFYHLEKQKI